jgi:hypothetical protein
MVVGKHIGSAFVIAICLRMSQRACSRTWPRRAEIAVSISFSSVVAQRVSTQKQGYFSKIARTLTSLPAFRVPTKRTPWLNPRFTKLYANAPVS